MAGTADLDTAAAVLAAVRDRKQVANQAEIDAFTLAVRWAVLHPPESIVQVATVDGTEDELTIAGPGAPLVAEFCLPELALALGMSSDGGKRYLGDAVETHYRLPKIWDQVIAGVLPVWKARRIAQATIALPYEGAGFVDRHLAPVAHTCSFTQLDRTVQEARDRYDPDQAEALRAERAEHRHLDIQLGDVTIDGLVHVDGLLDLADALAFEAAVAAKAHQLLQTHPDLSLEVRRAIAAGHLADNTDSDDGGTSGAGGISREVVIYTHHDTTSPDGLVHVENTHSYVTIEQLADWCQQAGTTVTIKPVIDLAKTLHTDAYTPTAKQREQAILRHPTCVFPHCTRSSRRCDLDHVIPWPLGPTATWNLPPLCRRHHRLKTHGGWTYQWTSPLGHTYRSR